MNFLNHLAKEDRTVNDIGLLLFRIVAGLALLYGHGFEKLSVIFSGEEIQFMDPIGIGATTSFYLAAFAEGICAVLLIFDLFSRWASLILTINFIVILIFHAMIVGDGFDVLELRFFYLASFIVLTLLGPGRISLDFLLFGEKSRYRTPEIRN